MHTQEVTVERNLTATVYYKKGRPVRLVIPDGRIATIKKDCVIWHSTKTHPGTATYLPEDYQNPKPGTVSALLKSFFR